MHTQAGTLFLEGGGGAEHRAKEGGGAVGAPFCQPPHWTFFTLRPQDAKHNGNAAVLQDIGACLDSALRETGHKNAQSNKPLFGRACAGVTPKRLFNITIGGGPHPLPRWC